MINLYQRLRHTTTIFSRMPEVGPAGHPSLSDCCITALTLTLHCNQDLVETILKRSIQIYVDYKGNINSSVPVNKWNRSSVNSGLVDPNTSIKSRPLNSKRAFYKHVDNLFGIRNIKHIYKEMSSLHIKHLHKENSSLFFNNF